MGSQYCPIEIYDDEESSSLSEIITLDGDDEEPSSPSEFITLDGYNDEAGDHRDDLEDFDSNSDDEGVEGPGGSTIELRAVTLPRGSQPIPLITRAGITLKKCTVIEIGRDFFYIDTSFHAPDGNLFASGYTLVRNRYVGNNLPKKTNEVALYASLPNEHRDAPLHQCQTIVPVPAVWVLRKCVFTNEQYPAQAYTVNAADVGRAHQAYAQDHLHITCRRKTLDKDPGKSDCEFGAMNLTKVEVEQLGLQHGQEVRPDRQLREDYIGSIRTEQRLAEHKLRIKQFYSGGHRTFAGDVESHLINFTIDTHADTYGDICAGAGGTTRGAVSAGLSLRFLLDNASKVIESLRSNFGSSGADIREQDISEFCRCQADGSMLVDILHISFPCCAHSYINHGGRNDQINIDVGYSIEPLLKKTRPLVVTFEQVPGIKTKRGGENYDDLIHQLTSCGFSVRARVVKMSDYGHPARRSRLIIFASCPGQSLPTIPEPTHGPGRRTLATIAEMLSQLNYRTIPDHMRASRPRQGEGYDPNRQMLNTFTGNGSLDLHFSALRTWMLAEAAVLQSFPPWHQFFGGIVSIMKQIGNAVPPVAAKVLFKHIRQHLQRTDAAFALEESVVDLT